MARMPSATWRPLGSNPSVEGTLSPSILCLHTMVGSLWGTDNYFHRDGYGGTESHFGVGYDGQILQWQDTRWRADANLDGGDRVVSIETADMGPGFPAWSGSNVPAWTPAQIEANAQICAWAHRTHGIPLVLIPNTAQSSRGIGYHRQGIDPWRCATCERWSTSSGKVCPGDRRVAQIPSVIARARQIVAPTPPPEDDLPTPAEVWQYEIAFGLKAGTMLSQAREWARQADAGVEALTKLVVADESNDITLAQFEAAKAEVLAKIDAAHQPEPAPVEPPPPPAPPA